MDIKLHAKKIKCDNLIYLLNDEEKTASIINTDITNGELFIPRSIKHESIEYIITSIHDYVFSYSQINSIVFAQNSEINTIGKGAFSNSHQIEKFTIPPHLIKIGEGAFSSCNGLYMITIPIDSELRTIEKRAFYETPIEEFTISKNLIELEKGWCEDMCDIFNISVSPQNPLFCCLDENFVIGKSSAESQDYEILVFCVRNIINATIPSFIKTIGAYSFNSSSIKILTIPPSITEICECAFSYCFQLKEVNFPSNSELKIIGNKAFHESSILKLSLPASLFELEEGWCAGINFLSLISLSENNPMYSLYDNKFILKKSSINSQEYDILVFCLRSCIKVTLPNNIRVIDSFAFNRCYFRTIEIPFDSNLQIIKKKAFAYSLIDSFTIPPHLTSIEEGAFDFCRNLRWIEIPPDSKLRTIKKKAFNQTGIESLSFPETLIDLEEGWCSYTFNLNRIDINENNPKYANYDDNIVIGKSSIDSEIFDILIFCSRDAEKVTLPSFIRIIDSFAFSRCKKLHTIEIPTNSELRIIKKYAFACSSIEKFTIPNHLTHISKRAFSWCDRLQTIDIQEDSELQTIDEYAFFQTVFRSFYFPAHLKNINNFVFYCGIQIQIFELDENTEIRYIDQTYFADCKNAKIMIPYKLCDLIDQIII